MRYPASVGIFLLFAMAQALFHSSAHGEDIEGQRAERAGASAVGEPTPDLTLDLIEDIGEQRAKDAGTSLVGKPAPDVAIERLSGETLQLADVLGHKPVYVKFWATWCVPCREQMPHLQSVYETYGSDLEVVALNAGINDDASTVERFRKAHEITAPMAIDTDGRIARALNLTVSPQHIVIDRTGTIRYVGHLANKELDEVLAAVVQEAPTTTSKPEPNPQQAKQGVANQIDHTIQQLDGSVFDLKNAGDQRPTVLFFFTNWCEWYFHETHPDMASKCVQYQERVGELHQRYGDAFRWLGIGLSLWSNEDDVRAYQKTTAIAYPLAFDKGGRWYAHYGIRDVPAVIVLAPSGTVAATIMDDIGNLDAVLSGF